LKGPSPLLHIKLDNNHAAGGGFDTFRKGSPDFRHANILQDNEEEENNNVYNSPLFMKKSLMASLKKSL